MHCAKRRANVQGTSIEREMVFVQSHQNETMREVIIVRVKRIRMIGARLIKCS